MSDIVERLRARNERFQSCAGNYLYYGGSDSILDCDAAAEIERLREALRPFAELAELFDDENRSSNMPATGVVYAWGRLHRDYVLTVEHLREARAALEPRP